jgi:type I restriction-modification system DNA methylase subunit
MSERERRLQDELYRLIANLVRDKRFAGLTLSVQTELELPINSRTRRADVAVLKMPEEIPVLIVETKRKVDRVGHYRGDERRFDPYGKAAIGQALSYAAIAKDKYGLTVTPAFATANRDVIVLFSPVRDPRRYLNWEAVEEGDYEQALDQSAYVSLIHDHYLLDDKNPLREELLQHILDQVAMIWQNKVQPETVRKRPGDWLLGKLRYFVDSVSNYYVEDVLRMRLMKDDRFAADLNALALKAGYKNGLSDLVGRDYSRVGTLARMMTYVLMNKIIFYKVLERHYQLTELKPILKDDPNISSRRYLELLNQRFREAIEKTGDFEQIFITGLFDHIVLSEERGALQEIDELVNLLSTIEVERLGDIIGYIYEDLIPAEERHQMGQFYTPQPIAELIARWCINGNPEALILGPGCGSGTFEIEAYWLLAQLKTGKKRGIPPGKEVHSNILRQIYAVDINPFPTQLTAMNLAMKNVRAPTTDANIVTSDFFNIIPRQKILAPYLIMTPSGPKRREIIFPESFDVVMGNPPYTRWTEIPEDTRQRILELYKEILTKYDLYRFTTGGAIPGIYIPWIIHSTNFLKEGGRLGMIISDSWLQTEYGIGFVKYLTDNFKIHAIIDISTRVFPVPLIGACIILLEKCSNSEERDSHNTSLVFLSGKKVLDIDAILKAIEEAKRIVVFRGEGLFVNVVKQDELRNVSAKPITFFFNIENILQLMESTRKVVNLRDMFQPSEGNTVWSVYASMKGKGAGVGGEDFYYVSEDKARRYGLDKYVGTYLMPLISSPDRLKYFMFTESDWSEKKEFMFIANNPSTQLPPEVQEYVKLGESIITITKGPNRGKPVSESSVAKIRRRLDKVEILGHIIRIHGWYDLGGVVETPIYIARGSQYWIRFVLAMYRCALDDRVLALIPRQGVSFEEVELKALLAYLNSSFAQLQAEVMGRSTGGGMIELDVRPLGEFLILDVKRLPREDLEELARLFDELEDEARKLGGADAVENVFGSELAKDLTGREDVQEGIQGLFNTVIKKIDEKVAAILEAEALVEPVRALVVELARRRLARAAEAKPGALKGSEELLHRPKSKGSKRKGKKGRGDEAEPSTRLDDFT